MTKKGALFGMPKGTRLRAGNSGKSPSQRAHSSPRVFRRLSVRSPSDNPGTPHSGAQREHGPGTNEDPMARTFIFLGTVQTHPEGLPLKRKDQT